MGSSESKRTETSPIPKTQNLFTQTDNLLDLLNEASTQKEAEYKEIQDKLNKKLENVLLAKTDKNDPNASAMLDLKYEKLKLKLKTRTEQHKTEVKFVSTIRKIHSDQKEKLRILENERTIQVANLNLDIASLNVEIDDLKQRVKDKELSYKANLQAKDFECATQRNVIVELKEKGQTQGTLQATNCSLGIEIANYKREVNSLQLREQELRKTHLVKYDAITTQLRTSESTAVVLRASNSRLDAEQSKYKQEIMFLKTQNAELMRQQVNDQAKYTEVLGHYNREKQNNATQGKEVKDLSDLLVNNVKLTTLQQRGTFLEIKNSLQGMKTDLQFLIPHLNERTIPNSFECNMEMEKLNVLMNRSQENLDKVIAYQGRFDHFVNSKRSLIAMEKTPNFLSGIELPCSFLHIKFLPLFRIAFSILESPDSQQNNVPRPLLGAPLHQTHRYNADNKSVRGAYNKSRQFTPKDNTASDGAQRNANFRRGGFRGGGRGGQNMVNKRRPRQHRNFDGKTSGNVSNDDSDDADSTSGVTLTVLTVASSTSAARTSTPAGKAVEKLDCAICCELLRHPLMSVKTLEHCVHKYHTSCIDEWFESNTECPDCAREDD